MDLHLKDDVPRGACCVCGGSLEREDGFMVPGYGSMHVYADPGPGGLHVNDDWSFCSPTCWAKWLRGLADLADESPDKRVRDCQRCHGRGWTILEVKDHKHAIVSACPDCNPNGDGA